MANERGSIPWSEAPELDAREVFFIRHAARIRGWMAIEADVRAHSEELLLGVAKDLERIGGVPGLAGEGVVLSCRLEKGYPKVMLRRPSWPEEELSVTLEWQAGKVSLEGHAAPYVGVLTTGSWREDPSRRALLIEHLANHRSELGGSTNSWWATMRRLPIPDRLIHDGWVDLAGYRDYLMGELVRDWHAVADILEAAVAEHKK